MKGYLIQGPTRTYILMRGWRYPLRLRPDPGMLNQELSGSPGWLIRQRLGRLPRTSYVLTLRVPVSKR
jgi:hypothetical protein